MNTILWIIQIVLAAGLLAGTFLKLFQEKEELHKLFPWTAFHERLATFTGIIDFLIGLGLLLPPLVLPNYHWVAYAAIALVMLMIAAAVFHISRGEAKQIGPNVVFAILAAIIVWGRLFRM